MVIIEIIILVIILLLQFYFFGFNYKKIVGLRKFFPSNISGLLYIQPMEGNVNIIESTFFSEHPIFFNEILTPTNNYLKKNIGATADYSLLQDISEKKSESFENAIQNTVNMPLYLGLMATFLGVSLGLFQFAFVKEFSSEVISSFLTGVLIAMGGSFVGLLLTVILNNEFNKAIIVRDAYKEEYYDFLRRELLPVASVSVGESLVTLAGNLQKFNNEFSDNINAFKGTIGKITENMRAQSTFLQKLENIEINKIAKANIQVFEKISTVSDAFEKIANSYDRIDQHYIEADDAVKKFVTSRTIQLQSMTEATGQDITALFDTWKKTIIAQENKFSKHINNFFEQLINDKDSFYKRLNDKEGYSDLMRAIEPLKTAIQSVKQETEKTRQALEQKTNSNKSSNEQESINIAILKELNQLNKNIQQNNKIPQARPLTKLTEFVNLISFPVLILLIFVQLLKPEKDFNLIYFLTDNIVNFLVVGLGIIVSLTYSYFRMKRAEKVANDIQDTKFNFEDSENASEIFKKKEQEVLKRELEYNQNTQNIPKSNELTLIPNIIKYARYYSSDKRFELSDTQEEDVHYYELTMDKQDSNVGYFTIKAKDGNYQEIISSINLYLGDTCHFKEDNKQANEGIHTYRAGKIEKTGGVWKLVKKANITYK